MPTRFASQFARTGALNLVRQFGESITYYADGAGTGRVINATVERNVEVPSETGEQVARALVVRVLDSVAKGILATELNDGGDEILVALVEGGTAERRQVGRKISTSNGFVRFVVR